MDHHSTDGTSSLGAPRPAEALPGLVGRAPALVSALRAAPAAARSNACVLVTGETGTGKELVARAVHELSRRAAGPFVAVNCGALVDTLLEDQLFGHERGAFTDAHTRTAGLLAQAAQGTVFLDEVDALTPRGQMVVLRVLQERAFRPVGGASEQRADVRFLAATNASLERLVQLGRFREDLYYRLCVFRLDLPPLRARAEDILTLARHFIAKHAPADEPVPHLSDAASHALVALSWPGNVRELENAVIRAVHTCLRGVIDVEDLTLTRARSADDAPEASDAPLGRLKDRKRRVVEAFERQYLVELMRLSNGNVSRAAATAGKERRELGRLLKKHGLAPWLLDGGDSPTQAAS